jgi:hypothetical protein
MRKAGIAIVALGLALAGCGAPGSLRPTSGEKLPVAPYGATSTPTPAELLQPRAQERPKRNDELLTQSEKRPVDPYDLPPQN